MRCLHVTSGLAAAGAEMWLYNLVRTMARSGGEPLVLSLSAGGALRPQIEALGVRVESLDMVRGAPPSPRALWRLREAVRRFRPDIVQGWMYHGNLAAIAAARAGWGRTPAVWSVHSSLTGFAEKRRTGVVMRLGARLSRHAARVIYVSARSADEHEAVGYDRSRRTVIPLGFDTERYAPDPAARAACRAALALPHDAVVIGHVARYHPAKDHATLLAAAALLAGRRPDVRFALVGRGVDASNEPLARAVAQHGLGDRVLLLGERGDVARLTAAFDVATLASRSEAFPNVIGEAMACGVPFVSTDVGDAAAIIGDTGRVVPPRAPEALAAAWEALVDAGADGRHALGVAARGRVEHHYSLPAIAAQYASLYESLVRAAGAGGPAPAGRAGHD